MIKSIFFDLDRTLLNSDKKIPNSSATALRRCRENGIKLFVATVRPPILDKMLNGYENSVAMDNADARVKAAANFVTKSNDADGIAYALKELLKII